ncbi:MAG: extracellular solute-binding protein [Propionibacteriales bacterium]|nr:extracellular solute-binding protein [Propionibacteriales bacterium]
MHSKRILGIVALVCGLALALGGCGAGSGPGNNTGGTVKIDFWYSASGVPADVLVQQVADFNAQYKDRIEVNAIYQGSYDDSMAKLTTAVQGGALPGLIQGGDTYSSYLKDTGLTVSPSEATDIDGKTFTGEDLVPIIKSYYTFDGTLSSVPVMVSQPVVVYNPALLKKAGIDPEAAPKSISELFEVATTINSKTGVSGITQYTNPWWAEQYTSSSGLLYCSPDNGTGKEPATAFNYTDPQQVALWTKVQDAVKAGVMPNTGTDGNASLNAFTAGKAALMVQSSRIYGDVKKAGTVDFGFWPLPIGSAEGGAVPGGNSVWIMKEGKSDPEVAAAATLAGYLASPASQKTIFEQTGYLPSSQQALTELVGSVDPRQKVLLDQFQETKATGASAGCHTGAMGEARTAVNAALEKIIGGADVTSSLQQAQDAGNKAIESYNSRR